MRKKKAKLEMETLGKILLLTFFLVIFLVLFKGCKDTFEDVGMVGLKEYMCWGTNLINAKGFRFFPTSCSPTIIEKKEGKELKEQEINNLIRKCWWMYGQGKLDIKDIKEQGRIEEIITKPVDKYHICYSFSPTEDISLIDLRKYLEHHKAKGYEADLDDSTWTYLQKGTQIEEKQKTNVICFDRKHFSTDEELEPKKTYYIIFYDDRGFGGEGERDRILISTDSKFGKKLTGVKAWIISLFYNHCFDIDKEYGKKLEAEDFFDKLVETSLRCVKITGDEACICDNSNLDPLNELPKDYSIRFKKIEEKKYEVSLLDKDTKVHEEDGKKSTRIIEGNRLGSWAKRESVMSRKPSPCLPGMEDEYSITKYLKDYFILYHPNNQGRTCCDPCGLGGKLHNPKEGDFTAIYLVQKELTGFKKCSEIK